MHLLVSGCICLGLCNICWVEEASVRDQVASVWDQVASVWDQVASVFDQVASASD